MMDQKPGCRLMDDFVTRWRDDCDFCLASDGGDFCLGGERAAGDFFFAGERAGDFFLAGEARFL
eukprot:5569281-Pleurochrysis_carterae.AAC.1